MRILHFCSAVTVFIGYLEPQNTLREPKLREIVAAYAKAHCPHDALHKVQKCTEDILPDLGVASSYGPHAATSHVHIARETCGSSRLLEAGMCIEHILKKCQGTTEQEQHLQRLIDKEKILDTIQYFCQNTRIYERHARCIKHSHPQVENCSQDAHDSFKTKLDVGASMDVLITGSCRYFEVALTCLTDIVYKRCGGEGSTFVNRVLTGLRPPYCEQGPKYSPMPPRTPTGRWAGEDGDSRIVPSSDGSGGARLQAGVIVPVSLLVFLRTYLSTLC